MCLISCTGLAVTRGRETILTGIDFEIARGELVTIVGPNGAGKTTFIRALIGAVGAVSGEVSRAAGITIGYMPQRISLSEAFPMTVRAFLELAGPRARRKISGTAGLTGVSGLLGRQMTDLSGGEMQRVLLTHAALPDPDILILDEPAQGLDPQGIAGFYRLIDRLRGQLGCAVLMVSHDLHVVMDASDRVICLNRHICCEGTPTHVAGTRAYCDLFGADTAGAFAIYPHSHDHSHDAVPEPAR